LSTLYPQTQSLRPHRLQKKLNGDPMTKLPNATRAFWLAATGLTAFAAPAFAQAPAAPPAAAGTAAAPAAPAPPAGLWIDGIHLSAQLEGGFTINPANPSSGVNFGRLFDDRANQPML